MIEKKKRYIGVSFVILDFIEEQIKNGSPGRG
jgi:hypothetical protein